MLTTTIFIASIRQLTKNLWSGLSFVPKIGTLPSSLYTFSNTMSELGSGLSVSLLRLGFPRIWQVIFPTITHRNALCISFEHELMVYYQKMPKSLTRSESVYKFLNPKGDPFSYSPKSNRSLEIIGLILWITEGDKTQLSLSNGNFSIIKQYLTFFEKGMQVKRRKIKAVIHCHDSLSYESCLSYWSKITNIPKNRFTKPYIKKDHGGARKYPYGIIRIAKN